MHALRPALTLALGAFGLATAALADAEPIGQAAKVRAPATAEAEGATRALEPGAPLYFGDALATGAGARLEAVLADDTRLTLGEKARLVLDAFVYQPEAPGARLAVRVLEGTFLFVGGLSETSPGAEVSIVTTFATLGVRGTTVWGGPIDGAFGVLVLDGEVRVTNGGQSVTLGPGQGTTLAGPQAAPQPPVTWPQDKVDRAIATVAFP